MPELPEVEHFRRLLLPLVSTNEPLTLELLGIKHQKKFLTPENVTQLNKENLVCQSIERRGKLICMVLAPPENKKSKSEAGVRYLYVHMGMTGRITTPERVPCFGHIESKLEAPDQYPPKFTYLQFNTASASACFSDPRKFGYVALVETISEFDSLAPDALTEVKDTIGDDAWCNYSACIKSVMLDQKKVVAGIGNWVADEILYQAELHPLQTYLTLDESKKVNETLKFVLETAVSTSDTSSPYPTDWLFHVRWGKGKKTGTKDSQGRTLKFMDAAGRTSAIVPTIQVLSKQGRGPAAGTKKKPAKSKVKASSTKKNNDIKADPDAVTSAETEPVPSAFSSAADVVDKKKRKSSSSAAATASTTKRIKKEKKEEKEPTRGERRSTRRRS